MAKRLDIQTPPVQASSPNLLLRVLRRISSRLNYIIPACLFVAALTLFIPRISVPGQYIYDEVYHAYTAGQYAAGNRDAYVWYTQPPREGVAYEWTHPPLGKLLLPEVSSCGATIPSAGASPAPFSVPSA